MGKNLTFGAEPNMREVPPGQFAKLKLGSVEEWSIQDTEWGDKYTFPITLLSHPSYESIPKKGLQMNWQSKSGAAHGLFDWMYTQNDDGEYIMKVFDHDMSDELNAMVILDRTESGAYKVTLEI